MEKKFRVWHLKEKKMYYRGYVKAFHVLLCEDDCGVQEGRGVPVKEASYEDCIFLQSSTLLDKNGREIFEGDKVRVSSGGKSFEGFAGDIPDMFRSRRLHPLHDLLVAHGVQDDAPDIEVEITGNCYENP